MATGLSMATGGQSADNPIPRLTSADEFFAPCPKFRILVLGNPESTKQELFSKVFGVELDKRPVANAFGDDHDIEKELDLEGQNERLAIYTSPNFGSDDESVYRRVCDFIASRSAESTELQERIHCIWYCVASEEERPVSHLETRFFSGGLAAVAPHVPVVLLYTKYDDFVSQVQMDWSHDAQQRGLSKVAVSHILKDLSTNRFEKTIKKRWDAVLLDERGKHRVQPVPWVCVASGSDPNGDDSSFEKLTTTTLNSLLEWKDWNVKLAFAAAQRNSATISTRFCADAATEYFTVETGHARKIDGVDMRDIVPNFFAKAIKIFNMRDAAAVLLQEKLLETILFAVFEADQRPLLEESLHRSSTEPSMLLMNLSPHERGVLLTQALASVVMFLDKLADTQWPQSDDFHTLTAQAVERELRAIGTGRAKQELLETVEGSPIFSTCPLKAAIAELIVKAVALADKISSPHGRGAAREILVIDDSELQEISLSFVNDKSPDDMVLPCGLTILPLN